MRTLILRKDYLAFGMLFFLAVALRLFSVADTNVWHSQDTGNIALAVADYNIAEERPHLPGYYLYVQLIRLLNLLIGNTHTSVIFLVILFSSLGTALSYLIFRKYFEISTSLILAAALMTNPLVWFNGSVTEIYSFDLFFSALFFLIGTNKRTIWLLPLLISLGAGIRQSSTFILLPLYIYFWYDYLKRTNNLKLFAISNTAGVLLLLSWLIPMLQTSGGVGPFLNIMQEHNPVPALDIPRNLLQAVTMGVWKHIPLFALLIQRYRTEGKALQSDNQIKIIIIVWLIPALLTFAFIHYTRGYWLIAAIPCYIIIGILIKNHSSKIILASVILLQSAYFLFFPYSLNNPEIFYNKANRSINSLTSTYLRSLSQNSLTLSHIKTHDKYTLSLMETLDKMNSDDLLLLDRTMPINARTLQTYHDGKIAELNPYSSDSYFLYSERRQINLSGRRQLIENSLIVGIMPFVHKIDTNIILIVRTDGKLVYYKAKQNKSIELKKIYQNYF